MPSGFPFEFSSLAVAHEWGRVVAVVDAFDVVDVVAVLNVVDRLGGVSACAGSTKGCLVEPLSPGSGAMIPSGFSIAFS